MARHKRLTLRYKLLLLLKSSNYGYGGIHEYFLRDNLSES